MFKCMFTLCLLCVLTDAALAQDGNYWSSPYGAGGFLTPGAVIAKTGDSGVLFYNPALLAYNTKNAASISGTIYQFEKFKVKNGAGTGLDLTSTSTSVIPQMASNTIYLKMKDKAFTVAYALVHSPVIHYQTSQRKDTKMNVLDDAYSPGTEYFIGQYSASNSVDETKAILSGGFHLTPKLAAGISAEVQIRSQTMLLNYSSRALINTGANSDTLFPPVVNVQEYYVVNSTNIGLQFKFGLAYDLTDNMHLGLLVSAPLAHISGKGSLLSDEVINRLRLDALELNLLANTRQEKLKSRWKMPLSAALGYTYDYGGGQFYFATEYFNKVKEYNVVTPRNDYFLRPDTANNSATSALIKLKDARKAILNVALGLSFPLKEAVTGFVALRTDFNYSGDNLYRNDDGFKANTAVWNNYHAQAGANFKKRKFNLRTGLLMTYGVTHKFEQTVNYDHPNENNLLIGDLGKVKATHFAIGWMFTYIHNL